MQRLRRSSWLIPAGLLFLVAACGKTPESTEQARGVLSGLNVVVAMTVVLIVVAGGLLVGALGFDRLVRSRKRLTEAPPDAEAEAAEERDEVVAGITVGRAGVPRWLYGFYVIIPLFAMMYVLTNVPTEDAGGGEPTATPDASEPCTECTVVASNIRFTAETLAVPAETEVTITFDNQDAGVPHNLIIWETEEAAQSNDEGAKLFEISQFNGVAEQDGSFTTPDVGTYYFNCTVHPTSMVADLEVVASS